MGADVRVVRLMRKIIRDQSNDPMEEETDQGDKQAIERTGQNDYFATDYFDVMKVEKKELSSSLTSIMGIWPDETMDVIDVAVQSYSLYCSTEILKSEADRKACGNPFSQGDSQMPFLSMIQVHITPEVLAHTLADESAEGVIHAIYEDLYTAIDEFIDDCESDPFVFRIYKMLSAGDFAVVLRAAKAETSFKVSSLLRRRIMKNSGGKKIVLYKTYTLLTFENNVIGQETEDAESGDGASQEIGAGEDRFVLRCCYSNLYWSNKENVDQYLKDTDMLSGIRLYGLNGRYDFSVRITEKQFLELLPDIKEYKRSGKRLSDSQSGNKTDKETREEKVEDGIVRYMRYLMENKYLSYINERYLVAQVKNREGLDSLWGNRESNIICAEPITTRKGFLDYKINELYEKVTGNYQKARCEVNRIEDYRKNTKHYMNLLNKLIKLCYGINGFSDTRIYAAVLLEQLDVILDSIGVYVKMYQEGEDQEEILHLLEEYIRESVCALDAYAQYIRNNNLQFLQTPNYNLESNMSMEKVLIGYSEFLKVFTEFYQRREGLTDKENCREYLPVVVPVLSKRDVSVEVLFPKGMMSDWEKEAGIWNEGKGGRGRDRCCMVISVPTLTELGNVRTMVTSLFHEAAHQFRYESRKERNDALLTYIIHVTMRDIMGHLMMKFQDDTGLRDWNERFGKLLEQSLVDAYMEMNYLDDKGVLAYSFQEVPLNYFQDCLENDLRVVFENWEEKSSIKDVLRGFLKEVMEDYQPDKSKCPEGIPILDDYVKEIEKIIKESPKDEEPEDEELEKLVEKIVRCAYGLSWECERWNRDKSVGCPWKEGQFKAWVEVEEEFDYQEEWEKVFGAIEEVVERKEEGKEPEKEIVRNRFWENFYRFADWMYENCEKKEKADVYNGEKKVRFLEIAYRKMCEAWSGKAVQEALQSDFDSVLSSMGREFGVDCETGENRKVFEGQMKYVIDQNGMHLIDMAKWRIGKYREETADMFMCNAMKLTPFGYMYMLAVGWPGSQEMANEYCNRSQNILLFQWCLDEDGQLSYGKFRTLCVGLVKELEEAVWGALKRLTGEGKEQSLSEGINASLEWEEERQTFTVLDRIEKLIRVCKDAEKRIVTQDKFTIKRECEMLKFYGIMAQMLEEPVYQGHDQIRYLRDFKELQEDYVRGIQKLKSLNADMCKDQDPLVRQLGEFCKKLSVLQNKPYLSFENVEKNEEENTGSIEFLLNMYYANKRRVAREMGGAKCP